ncbi:MAG: fumarylacetoacetate hydrolase family protein [Sulfobacillus sp.]
MKLARQQSASGPRVVAVTETGVADLGPLLKAHQLAADSMRGLIRMWADLAPLVRAEIARQTAEHRLMPLVERTLLVPVEGWGRVIGIGHNYQAHAAEAGHGPPPAPEMFLRLPSSLTDPFGDILLPVASQQLDLEVELAVVIGSGGRGLSQEAALASVFGYTVANDISVRDVQHRTSQWTPGKNFDQTAPVGPWIVTKDEIDDAQALRLRSWIGAAPMQDGTSADMIFAVPELVAAASAFTTLEPGDLILTGTPAGTGNWRTPPRWLLPGEVVTVSVEAIGQLKNKVVLEQKHP